MNKIELVKMAFINLFRRKLRSFLAILGVLIGTSSIVIMVSIGLAISDNFEKQMTNNENLHIVQVHGISGNASTQNNPALSNMKMDDKAVKYIKKIPSVTAATGSKSIYINVIIDGKYIGEVNIQGVDPVEYEKFGYKLEDGRNFKNNDEFAIIFGKGAAYSMRNVKTGEYLEFDENGNININLISNKIELTSDRDYKREKIKQYDKRFGYGGYGGFTQDDSDKVSYEVFKGKSIGVLASENNSYSSYMDMASLEKILKSNSKAEKNSSGFNQNNSQTYDMIMIYVEDINKVEEVCKELKNAGFYYYSVIDMIRETQKSFFMVQATLGGIGAISLLVAAIGITNTMIMSIYERTREIGIMKVLGARLRDIKNMFLYEAAFIGLVGGVLGSIFSGLVSFALNKLFSGFAGGMFGMGYGSEDFAPRLSYIPLWLIVSAILFSTVIGVIAGFLPARRAMKMSALSSLRNE